MGEKCKYCKPNWVNYGLAYNLGPNGGSLHCHNGWLKYEDEYNESFNFVIKINYCPMCGRKLEV